MIPARRSWVFDDHDEDRLHVFVPGAMGAGILLSIGVLLSDAYRRLGGQRLARRRIATSARAVAAGVVGADDTAPVVPVGVRHPRVYVMVVAAGVGLAALLLSGATWNYFNPNGYVNDIAWLWAGGVVTAIFFARVAHIAAYAVPQSLPPIVGAAGLGITLRFTQLSDGIVSNLVVASACLSITTLGVYLARRRAAAAARLPGWAWHLFVSTPLTKPLDPDDAAAESGTTRAGQRLAREGVRLVAALGTLVVAAALVADPPATWEVEAFRALNGLPHVVDPAVWAVTQVGSSVMVPVAAAALWLRARDWKPVAALFATSVLIGWLAAQGIQELAARGRPAALFDDAILGVAANTDGVGFPSGHAVVVFMVATALSRYVPRRVRWGLYGVAVLVALTRLYIGAHMPLDLIGGAALGVIAGTLVHVVAPRLEIPSREKDLTFQSDRRHTVMAHLERGRP